MAVFLRGMNDAEQVALTLAMRDSGTVLSWQGLDGPVLDKHSTGGVGDLVSLVLAPLVAACGGYVPMISGRGLGHTGGTLDKLESIPGFEVNPPLETMRHIVAQAGFAMVGQGPDLAPADHRMYAVRDVTATVSSIPLIASSILSKKLAEGLDALVMDIKTGNGAFMTDPAQARRLAEDITRIASDAGLQASALLTDMDQPLASNAGNALEMREALDWLRGRPCNARLQAVTLALAGELLQLGGLADSPADAEQKLQQALDSGRAAERFARMVALQGGPADLLERPAEYLPAAPVVVAVPAPHAGHVGSLDTRAIGVAVQALGGGRRKLGDTIDPRVGFSALCAVGDSLQAGQPLAMVHAANEADAARAVSALQAAVTLSEQPVSAPPAVLGRIHDPSHEQATTGTRWPHRT
jgi:thymidine phosphorylase